MAEYIDRTALAEKLFGLAVHYTEQGRIEVAKDYNWAITLLMAAPTADVAPVKHGRWISWKKADNCIPSANRHECSVCHDSAHVLVNNFELLSFYCPNCGAKMHGGADREED